MGRILCVFWGGRVKGLKEAKGGTIVLRPDSGEPVEQVSPDYGAPLRRLRRSPLRRLPWASACTLGEGARARGARPSP